jgi:hypothetical protein
MGRQAGDQSQLFYLFNLERRIPASHLLRRINPIVTRILAMRRPEFIALAGGVRGWLVNRGVNDIKRTSLNVR